MTADAIHQKPAQGNIPGAVGVEPVAFDRHSPEQGDEIGDEKDHDPDDDEKEARRPFCARQVIGKAEHAVCDEQEQRPEKSYRAENHIV